MTDREKYIAELASYLSPLGEDEREDALEFYDEYISDANLGTWDEIKDKLGTPRQLSYKILADYSIRTNNEETAKSGRPASPKSNWRVFWWVLIAIITSPITFTLGIAAIGIMIGLVGAALGVLVGALAIVITVVAVACALLYTGIVLLFSEPLTGLYYLWFRVSICRSIYDLLTIAYVVYSFNWPRNCELRKVPLQKTSS